MINAIPDTGGPFKNDLAGGDLQDGRGVRRRDHLPLHKHIRNTSTCGTTPTEHLLNTGRRSQKARNSPRTWVGQKKKEKIETKNRDGTHTSGRELRRRKGFHTLEAPSLAETVGGGGGKLRSHGGEHSHRGAEGKAERFPHRGSGRPALTSQRGLSAHPLGQAGDGS